MIRSIRQMTLWSPAMKHTLTFIKIGVYSCTSSSPSPPFQSHCTIFAPCTVVGKTWSERKRERFSSSFTIWQGIFASRDSMICHLWDERCYTDAESSWNADCYCLFSWWAACKWMYFFPWAPLPFFRSIATPDPDGQRCLILWNWKSLFFHPLWFN